MLWVSVIIFNARRVGRRGTGCVVNILHTIISSSCILFPLFYCCCFYFFIYLFSIRKPIDRAVFIILTRIAYHNKNQLLLYSFLCCCSIVLVPLYAETNKQNLYTSNTIPPWTVYGWWWWWCRLMNVYIRIDYEYRPFWFLVFFYYSINNDECYRVPLLLSCRNTIELIER